jgi:RNA polymerase sigma-70 factor, ECF subfamily
MMQRQVRHEPGDREGGLMHDDMLARSMCNGDERALGQLYDRYGRLVYSIAVRVTGSHETAEEVTQDTFQQAWQSIGSYRVGNHLGAWLCGIARHRAIDAQRSRRERARQREDTNLDSIVAQADDAFAPAQAAEACDLRTTVLRALHALPPTQRQALELAYYGGLTCNEIAARTNTPPGTVRSRLRLGMSRLRMALEPYIRE